MYWSSTSRVTRRELKPLSPEALGATEEIQALLEVPREAERGNHSGSASIRAFHWLNPAEFQQIWELEDAVIRDQSPMMRSRKGMDKQDLLEQPA